MIIEFEAATKEELEQANRFTTYYNYVSSINNFINGVREDPTVSLNQIVQSSVFQNIQGGRCKELDKVSRLLRNAWYTELQLGLSSLHSELLCYSNHWAPVQLYYIVYLTIRAYFISKGEMLCHDHAATLRAISEEIRRRPELFVNPWNVCCIGNPYNKTLTYSNLPPNVEIKYISSLSSSVWVDFWDSFTMFLKTTRCRQIEKLCTDWKERNKRKRINPNEKRKIISNLGPTSIFNCLYRLRLRSNYTDADSFLMSSPENENHYDFHNGLVAIAWCSLMIFELLIARYIGKARFKRLVENYVQYDKHGFTKDLVTLRWEVMKNLW